MLLANGRPSTRIQPGAETPTWLAAEGAVVANHALQEFPPRNAAFADLEQKESAAARFDPMVPGEMVPLVTNMMFMCGRKCAAVLRLVDIVREHAAPCPAQSPSHAPNTALPVGVAVKMTLAPGANETQFGPQHVPSGLVATVPAAPAMPTVTRVSCGGVEESSGEVEEPQP